MSGLYHQRPDKALFLSALHPERVYIGVEKGVDGVYGGRLTRRDGLVDPDVAAHFAIGGVTDQKALLGRGVIAYGEDRLQANLDARRLKPGGGDLDRGRRVAKVGALRRFVTGGGVDLESQFRIRRAGGR